MRGFFEKLSLLFPRVNSERAVSTLELALVVPLLMVVIVGITDFGLMLRKNQVLAGAARHGAFSASRATDRSFCNDDTLSCAEVTDNRPENPNDEAFVALAACDYLARENFNLEDWEVSILNRTKVESVDGVPVEFPFVEVNVSLIEGARGCVMCTSWPLNTEWFGRDILWGDARYPLQGRC